MKTHLSVLALLALAILLVGNVGTVQASQPAPANFHGAHSLKKPIELSPHLLFAGMASAMAPSTVTDLKPTPPKDLDANCPFQCMSNCWYTEPCTSICITVYCVFIAQ